MTKIAGVIGWPVEHSKSPKLHGFWLKKYGIDGEYRAFPVQPDRLAAAVEDMVEEGFAGANCTIPHKESVMALCDQLTHRAERIGAVNTLVFQKDGSVFGDNTDGFGFIENLRDGAPELDFSAAPAVLLGAGGASRGLAVALLDAGCPEVVIANRTLARAEKLVSDLHESRVRAVAWDGLSADLGQAGLLINATSLGMVGQPELEIDLDGLNATAVVTDIVYAPLKTRLLARAEARGHVTVDGLGMLLHQARPGFEAWFGIAPVVDAALREHVLL